MSKAKVVVLENGLTLILKEEHRAPVATAQVWSRTGSITEGNWMGAGMSHVLEHMLFKGTTHRKGSQIDREVQDAGGQMNACTSFNYTLYYIDIPATGLTTAIDILCDIAQNATLPADELEKERQVILREMDMGMDDPDRHSSRRLFETAYQVSPYRHPVIGYRDVFERFTRDDLMAYYRLMYAPNNLFFVVTGDFQADKVEQLIREKFANAKRGALPPINLPSEPPQIAPRKVEEEGSVELVRTHIAWHIPHALHPDIPALGIISSILGSGRSSRLFLKIREELGLVQNIDSWIYSPGNQGLFGISAELETAKYRDALKAVAEEIKLLKEKLIPSDELEKIKKQCISALYATRKTTSGLALELGSNWLAAGNPEFSEQSLEMIKNTTAEDVMRVANTWFTDANQVLYTLLPEGSLKEIREESAETKENPIQKILLSNGLRLLIKEDNSLPFVEIHTVFNAGLRAENEENSGISLLTSRMLLKGTESRSAEDISVEIENVGGKIENWVSHSSLGISEEVMKEDVTLAIDLLADIFLKSTFPEEALELEKQFILADIRAEKDHVLRFALKEMRRGLFGNTSFGLGSGGNEKSVTSLNRQKVQDFCKQFLRPDNCVLSIFGNINAAEIEKLVREKLADWQPAGAFNFLHPNLPAKSTQTLRSKQDKKQAVVTIGFHAINCFDPDYYPLLLLQEACSDLGSRLFTRIRDELALAYYVGAAQQSGIENGYFCFYAGTEPGKSEQVIHEIFEEIKLLRTEGLTEEELKRSKAKILGSWLMNRQDLSAVARNCAVTEIIGRGYNFYLEEPKLIEAITLEDIRRCAQRILTQDDYVISLVEPETEPENK